MVQVYSAKSAFSEWVMSNGFLHEFHTGTKSEPINEFEKTGWSVFEWTRVKGIRSKYNWKKLIGRRKVQIFVFGRDEIATFWLEFECAVTKCG